MEVINDVYGRLDDPCQTLFFPVFSKKKCWTKCLDTFRKCLFRQVDIEEGEWKLVSSGASEECLLQYPQHRGGVWTTENSRSTH
jgi:hypothetical protein